MTQTEIEANDRVIQRLNRDIQIHLERERKRIALVREEIKLDREKLSKLKSERGVVSGKIFNATKGLRAKVMSCRVRKTRIHNIERAKLRRRLHLKRISIRKAQQQVARDYNKQWYANYLRPQDQSVAV